MSKLPANAELIVETAKIEEYLLNRSHPLGAAKANYFLGIGFSHKDVGVFAESLREHGRTRQIVREVHSAFGKKLLIECQLVAPSGTLRCIRSVWINEEKNNFRLITAHPVSEKAEE